MSTGLLAKEGMVRKAGCQHLADGLLGATVGLGDRRTVGLELDGQVAAEQRTDHGIGGVRRLERGGQFCRTTRWQYHRVTLTHSQPGAPDSIWETD
jgi:hypothetical protein